ncbi:MAG TPA: 5'-nucleotidase C-terminal domain-containing protein [Methylomirabilota bacterium]|nr:5'-nucleotidase C-terminal domain-containing protein [Methylomirabilota bacterium]
MGPRNGLHLLALAVLLSLLALPAAGDETQRLTILHTSDLHGSLLPFDDFRNRPADGSLAQIATLVGRVRAEVDHPVVLLDSGDTIQGTPLEQFAHVRWSEPSPTIETMNLMGYDAMAIGNHEFNFGLEVLRRAQRQADFPFLSANTVDEASGRAAFPEHMVVEVGEVRVGVVGLVTPNIPGWERPEHYRGLAFRAMDETVREQVGRLRVAEGCDLVVVLAHTGFESDLDSGDPTGTGYENFGVRLTRVAGIDVLLTGHTHRDVPPRQVNGVIVSQPSARGRALTRLDLELERGADGWRISSWQGENLAVDGVAADPEISGAFAGLHLRVVEALDGPVGEITEALSIADCRLRDCPALDLIHQVQLEASGAELSLASLLSRSTPDLPAGPLTWRWIHGFYVYPNTLVKLRVTGRQVLDILEHAARVYDGLECSPEGRCTVLTDPAIPHYNVDSMAGVSYRVDPTRPEGQRVLDVRVGGHPIDPAADFTLVCNNYRAVGGGGYPHLEEAERLWQSSDGMTDLIGDFIARRDPWRPTVDANWWLGPLLTGERPAAATSETGAD